MPAPQPPICAEPGLTEPGVGRLGVYSRYIHRRILVQKNRHRPILPNVAEWTGSRHGDGGLRAYTFSSNEIAARCQLPRIDTPCSYNIRFATGTVALRLLRAGTKVAHAIDSGVGSLGI
jgi:hypothetical protein